MKLFAVAQLRTVAIEPLCFVLVVDVGINVSVVELAEKVTLPAASSITVHVNFVPNEVGIVKVIPLDAVLCNVLYLSLDVSV